MKTAEQILDGIIIDDDYFEVIYRNDCLFAMREYAQERTRDYYPKEFCLWTHEFNNLHCERCGKRWRIPSLNRDDPYKEYTLDELFNYYKSL